MSERVSETLRLCVPREGESAWRRALSVCVCGFVPFRVWGVCVLVTQSRLDASRVKFL